MFVISLTQYPLTLQFATDATIHEMNAVVILNMPADADTVALQLFACGFPFFKHTGYT